MALIRKIQKDILEALKTNNEDFFKNIRNKIFHNYVDEELFEYCLNNQQSSYCLNVLGLIFSINKIIKDDKIAFDYFKKSADMNNSYGISNLAYFYVYGIEVDKNIKKAKDLYQKSIDMGNSIAILYLSICYRYGDISKRDVIFDDIGIYKDYQKCFELCEKAASDNIGEAINELANLYHWGIGTHKNDLKAFELYKKAASMNNTAAVVNLLNAIRTFTNELNINNDEIIKLAEQAFDLEILDSLKLEQYYEKYGTHIFLLQKSLEKQDKEKFEKYLTIYSIKEKDIDPIFETIFESKEFLTMFSSNFEDYPIIIKLMMNQLNDNKFNPNNIDIINELKDDFNKLNF